MKIVVVGSGLIGVTSAYFLARDGHDVTVVDRRDGPGKETSYANGGLLTPSMADPWNAPGSWRTLLSSIGRPDAAMKLRLRALPSLAGWGIRFLRNSSPAAFERNTRSNLRLAKYSLEVMEVLRTETNIMYGRSARGTLRIFRDPVALRIAVQNAKKWASEGLVFRELTVPEVISLEPGLEPIVGTLAGGIHYPQDETGNAYQFCVAMREQAARAGVEFAFEAGVQSLTVRGKHVVEAVTGQQRFSADAFVVAAGSYSPFLMHGLRIALPLRPVKGYSVTFEDLRHRAPLGIPVVDDELHAVVTPLDGSVRVAGTAEFTGYDLTLRPERIENLMELAGRVLPKAQLTASMAKPWCGLRPMSADGVPIVGATALPNLFVSTGHGHLGWTMAAGSAKVLSDVIGGRNPAIDPSPYTLQRFSSVLKAA